MIDVKIKCDSCKFVDGCVDYGWSECKKFTPKPSEPITNEEWFCKLSTEEKAKWLSETFDICGAGCGKCFIRELCFDEHNNKMPTDLFAVWLKQKH